jgi:hypothetical protein
VGENATITVHHLHLFGIYWLGVRKLGGGILQIKRGALLLSFPSASKLSETRFSAGRKKGRKLESAIFPRQKQNG